MPGEEDLSEAEAVQIACDRLASIGYDMASYQKSVWYKTGDPLAQGVSRGGPVYIVFFLDDSDNPTSAFSVTIDAITGKVDGTDTPCHCPQTIERCKKGVASRSRVRPRRGNAFARGRHSSPALGSVMIFSLVSTPRISINSSPLIVSLSNR